MGSWRRKKWISTKLKSTEESNSVTTKESTKQIKKKAESNILVENKEEHGSILETNDDWNSESVKLPLSWS